MTDGYCRLDLEDREFIDGLSAVPTAFEVFSRPSEVPVDWHKTENQGPIGSCQGNGLTSCLERTHYVRTREKIQLSRIFAYLATQKIDGLLGRDAGSTISGGAKLATQSGVPLESVTGYPSGYPRNYNSYLTAANYAAGEPYKAVSQCRLSGDAEEVMQFVGGGGAVSFGVPWHSGVIPRDRVVRSFVPGRGGHAMCVLGYRANGDLAALNSHGDGLYWITPKAWHQMMSHHYSVAVGLMGNEGQPVDWLNDSYFV